LLSVLPDRITSDLIHILERFNGQVVFVTHINHANELAEENQSVLRQLAHRGHALFNQSVLLKGVNDRLQVLEDLSHKLMSSSVTPYYLHRLDRVQGAAHFDLDDRTSRNLYRELCERLPGYLLPRMVDEIPGRLYKSSVHCD
jgi:KamA family protein